MNNPQLNKHGELQHLLTTEGLPVDIVRDILDRAATFVDVNDGREIKKVPLLHGKSVFNMFFESSTRTRTTFEIGAMRIPRRRCSTCSPSGITRRNFTTCAWRSSATCCIRAWRARRSTR